MGDVRKKHKRFNRPRKAFDKFRIEEENSLVKKYGLKNKREIWKANLAIKNIRDNAKKLITADEKMKEEFIERLKKKGFKVDSIEDALGLNKEDWLARRLQTILSLKKLASTPKQARQLIVHKHVAIEGKRVNIPSYFVSIDEEDKIKVFRKTKEMIEKKVEGVANG